MYTDPSATQDHLLTVLISELSISQMGYHSMVKNPRLPYYLTTAGEKIVGCILSPWVLALCKKQTAPLIYIKYHRYVVSQALISLNLSRHSSLLSIASGRSFRLHTVSVQGYFRYLVVTHLCIHVKDSIGEGGVLMV